MSDRQDGAPQKEVIVESAKELSTFIDNNFNEYFRILIAPFDYKTTNGYLREIVNEIDEILDWRFTMIIPEKA